jgi:N-acetylglucosamine kinase-like BadF-type ATPase
MYLGIDGGGTKTKLVLMDKKENIIAEALGGPSSIDTVTTDVTGESITTAWNTICNEIGYVPKIDSVFAGLGGIVHDYHSENIKSLIYHLDGITTSTLITVKNDMYNALASSLKFSNTIALIVGTGMVAFGIDKSGKTYKSGGWGYKEGDSGSAYDLGFQAIRKMIRAYDNRLENTDFTQAIYQVLELKSVNNFVDTLEEWSGNRTRIASLAPIVTKFANQGDIHAVSIVEQATDELASAVKAVYEKLSLTETTCVVIGSLGNADGVFKDLLHSKIVSLGSIKPIAPKVDPAVAAAILALNQKL